MWNPSTHRLSCPSPFHAQSRAQQRVDQVADMVDDVSNWIGTFPATDIGIFDTFARCLTTLLYLIPMDAAEEGTDPLEHIIEHTGNLINPLLRIFCRNVHGIKHGRAEA
ncbi:hypothetical protein M5689_013136 [Euphorbia peplus]|nr:hypothetical protein M5689_013136 [Euphorbia peplus]